MNFSPILVPDLFRRASRLFLAAVVGLLPCGLLLLVPLASSPPAFGQKGGLAKRLPLPPHTAKLDVSDPKFTITTDAAGDYVIRYRDDNRQPVKVVYEPPNKVLMTLAAAVEADGQGNFTFLYEPANAADSPQSVDALLVEFQGVVLGVRSPPGWAAGPFKMAIYWHPANHEDHRLPAGSRIAGFAMSASVKPVSEKFTAFRAKGFFHFEGALPGIVNCHASGAGGILAYPDEPPGDISDHLPRFPENGVGGRTVGPVVLPVDGQIPWLLERLSSYAKESQRLGWLEDPARLQKYLLLIDQVGRQVENKSFLLGQQMLQAFRRQVELDFKMGFLTSESYALFLHNSSYLEQLLAKAK